MLSDAIKAAAERALDELRTGFPGTILIGTRKIAGAVTSRRADIELASGGFVQGMMLVAHVPHQVLAESGLINTIGDLTKRQTLTHDGTVYRIRSVTADSHGTTWIIRAEQEVR